MSQQGKKLFVELPFLQLFLLLSPSDVKLLVSTSSCRISFVDTLTHRFCLPRGSNPPSGKGSAGDSIRLRGLWQKFEILIACSVQSKKKIVFYIYCTFVYALFSSNFIQKIKTLVLILCLQPTRCLSKTHYL